MLKLEIVRVLPALLPLLLLSACVAYQPQPLAPTNLAAARAERSLDAAAVTRRVNRMVPTAQWDGSHWDRLTLFAAALDNSPTIAASRAALQTAITAARAARIRTGPTLTLTSEYSVHPPESSPWLFGGVFDFPIETAGRRRPRLTSIDLAVTGARQDLAETIWGVRMAIRRALTDRLIAARQIALFDAIIAVRQRQFAVVERRVVAGAASRADLERVRADAADAVRRRADAGTLANSADAALAAAIGIPANAVTGIALTWDNFDAPLPAPAAPDANARAAALASRADVLKSVVAYDQSDADLRGEIAKQYPAISIGPGFTWERGLVKLPVNVGLVLPPLDLNRSAIAAAQARRTEAGVRLESTVATAQSEIDRAYAAAAEARHLLVSVRSGEIPAADRLAAQADRELAAGSIDRSEWAAAAAGARLARASELDALARVQASDATLEDALRRPLWGPELAINAGNGTTP